jgi:hypothetical protein
MNKEDKEDITMNRKRSVLSFVLAIALALGAATPALANESGNISGDSEVKQVVIKATVPTSLSFGIDPLSITSDTNSPEDNQIANQNYQMINKTTEAAIAASFFLTADLADGVKLFAADDSTNVKPEDLSASDKNLSFGVLTAKEVTTDTTTPGSVKIVGTTVYDKDLANGLVSFGGTDIAAGVETKTSEAAFGFMLEKAQSATELATTSHGIGSFQFYGKMNSYADWQPNDVKVKGVYSLLALSAATVANVGTPIGLNMIPNAKLPGKPDVPAYTNPGFIVGGNTQSTASATVSIAASSDTTIPFYAGEGANLSAATLRVGSTILPSSDFELTTAGLVLKSGSGSNFGALGIVGTYTLYLGLGGQTYTVNLTMTV